MRRFSDVFPTDPDAVPAYTFEADGGRTTWTLVDSHCDDPACLECASEAKLIPADPAQAAMEFTVNLDKGELSLPEGWTDLQKATCLDFLKSPPTRNVLLRRHQAVRADALRHVRRTRRAFDGALQCLTDFSPVQEPFLLPFQHLGEAWIAADLHCVAPGCPCANVQLSFSQPTRADRRLHEHCTILLDLDSGLRVDKGTDHLPAAPDDLVASFLASFPDWKLELLRRRRLVRAAAGRLLTFRSSPGAPPAAPPARALETAGRNEPCACGSGRKFKKCCGK